MPFIYRNILLLFFAVIFSGNRLAGQIQVGDIQINTHYGFILPHHKAFYAFVDGYMPAAELKVTFQNANSPLWRYVHKFPKTGGGLFFVDFKSNGVLGSAVSTYGFIKPEIIASKHFKLTYNLGAGAAYVSKIFDAEANPLNIAVSTHIDAFLKVGIEGEYTFNKMTFFLGGEINHFSNGRIKKPNSGINLFSAKIGAAYILNDIKPDADFKIPTFEKQNIFSALLRSGVFQFRTSGKTYPFTGISLEYIRKISFKHGFGITFDNFYNDANNTITVIDTVFGTNKGTAYYNALTLGYNVFYGKVQVSYQFGAYLIGTLASDAVFSRIGFRYNFYDNWLIGTALNNYFGRANFIEWSIGYRYVRQNKKH